MTEFEWLHSADLKAMLAIRQVRNRKRKLRLFAIASVRQLARWITDDRLVDVLTTCERYTDGEMKRSGLAKTKALATRAWLEAELDAAKRDRRARLAAHRTFTHMIVACQFDRTGADREDNIPLRILDDIDSEYPKAFLASLREIYPQLLRDIVGNPFRTIVMPPRWRTPTVVGLAKTMYDTRNFNAMPVLADALQEAGCEDAAILDHCRGNLEFGPVSGASSGPNAVHVRGCWVVDQVLGKS